MDLYIWVMRNKGFDVDDVGYFLYCDGDRFTDHAFLNETHALMEFKITLIPYKCDLNWIETTLKTIHENLRLEERPKHSDNCEYGKFIHESSETSKKLKIKTLF